MIKKITRTVLKEVTEVESEIMVCDICGKELKYEKWLGKEKIASYYHIRTGHYDWGNDSCESVTSRDACCDECLSRFTQEWLKDEDVISSNTAYIEINKDRHVLKGEKS